MRILFIAPVPPPVTGQSLAVSVIYDELKNGNEADVINTSKGSFQSGVNSLGRIVQVLRMLKSCWNRRKRADVIYFALSESFAGNIKDLFIYAIFFKALDRMVIHMLGGAGMKRIVDNNGFQYKLNKYFICRVNGIIVEGCVQADTFSRYAPRDRIHIVPNFAEDYLFISEKELNNKYANLQPIRILFLSNLLNGKGYLELVNAYIDLSEELKSKMIITFVGGFQSEKSQKEFLAKIRGHRGVDYYGWYVGGEEKKALYNRSHVFCLPTYYPYEGQPISILEAYATGCVVVTTSHSGIPDIFESGKNGYEVEARSSESLKRAFEQILASPQSLFPIAKTNWESAQIKYRTSRYGQEMLCILQKKKA